MNPRLKVHYERFSYKDYKGQFKIIIDGMPSKQICFLVINENKKAINVKGKDYSLSKISSFEITKYNNLVSQYFVSCLMYKPYI